MDLSYTIEGAGFPVVFVHAFPLDGRMWEPNVPAVVSNGFRAVVPDLPGFGGSRAHPGTTTMEALASSIAEILEEEGIEKAVFCGLSMGGYALLSLFRSRPDLFAGLVLCDTTADADTNEKRAGRAELIAKVLSQGNKILVRELLPKLVSPATITSTPSLLEELASMILDQAPEAVIAALRGMAERPDSNPHLPGIGIPVKLIFGRDDLVTGESAAYALASGISKSELSFIDRAGHLSNLEAPAEFNHELLTYLKSLRLTH